jgi:hypothetical protein
VAGYDGYTGYIFILVRLDLDSFAVYECWLHVLLAMFSRLLCWLARYAGCLAIQAGLLCCQDNLAGYAGRIAMIIEWLFSLDVFWQIWLAVYDVCLAVYACWLCWLAGCAAWLAMF